MSKIRNTSRKNISVGILLPHHIRIWVLKIDVYIFIRSITLLSIEMEEWQKIYIQYFS